MTWEYHPKLPTSKHADLLQYLSEWGKQEAHQHPHKKHVLIEWSLDNIKDHRKKIMVL
jgi:hypothetical protein